MVQQDLKNLEYNPGSELNLFSLNIETMTMKSKESDENKSRTKDERKSRTTIIKSSNTDKILNDITGI